MRELVFVGIHIPAYCAIANIQKIKYKTGLKNSIPIATPVKMSKSHSPIRIKNWLKVHKGQLQFNFMINMSPYFF